MRRIPLWVTIVPLLLGLGLWVWLWNGYEANLKAELKQVLPAGTEIEASGFPYRLEASVKPLSASFAGEAVVASISAEEARLNRVPWQKDRQVIALQAPRGSLALKPVTGGRIDIKSESALASLRLEEGRIARLSIVWNMATLNMGLFAAPASAGRLETHLRETPATAALSKAPTHPTQVQIMMTGEDVRFGRGDPLALNLEAELTSGAPIKSFGGWAGEGTAEIRTIRLADKTGEVAKFRATIVPGAEGRLLLNGTVETVCPANVRSAVAGGPPVSERRQRRPETLTISGVLGGAMVTSAADASKPTPPVRGMEPPCPRLR